MSTTVSKPHLPVSRVNTIMRSCSDVETVGKEASQLMCKAAEYFIKTLASEAYQYTNNGRKLDYKHLAEVVHSDDRYEFLMEIMPKKITVLEYKKILAKKQRLENDSSSSSSSGEDDDSTSGEDTSVNNSGNEETKTN